MVLISRISRLFRADLHAVLDRIEEPEALLRQAIREMEELLAQDEQRSRLLQEEQRQLTSRQNKLEHELDQIKGKLGVCFQSNEEDLARKLIRRQLETLQFNSHLSAKHKTLEDSIGELGSQLEENRDRLDNMRQKAELLITEDRGEHPENAWSIADYRAQKANERIAEKPENIDFYHAKVRTAEFYFERIFPKVRTLGKTMMANPQSLMRITSEQF